MRKNKNLLLLLLSSVLLTACDFSVLPEAYTAQSMRLDRHEATLMVGDTCELHMLFVPEMASVPTAYWRVDGNSCSVEDKQGVVIGRSPGDSQVYAITLNGTLRDTCQIHVLRRWDTAVFDDYQYDMVVYADVDIQGFHNSDSVMIGAFYGEELRGVGRLMTWNDNAYTAIRIYHNRPNGGKFTFRYYIPSSQEAGTCDYTVNFDGEAHGLPSQPILITTSKQE